MTGEIKWMLGVWGLFLAASLSVFQAGCGSKSSPTGPVAGAVTFTWAEPFISEINGGSGVEMGLEVNGAPYTAAAVSLSGNFPGAPVALAYDGPVSHSGHAYSDYYNGSFTYSPGSTYVLSTDVLGTVGSVTLVAPGAVTWQTATAGGAVTLVTCSTPVDFSFLEIENSAGATDTLSLSNFTFPVTINTGTTYPITPPHLYGMDVGAGVTVSSISNATLAYGAVSIYQEWEASISVP